MRFEENIKGDLVHFSHLKGADSVAREENLWVISQGLNSMEALDHSYALKFVRQLTF